MDIAVTVVDNHRDLENPGDIQYTGIMTQEGTFGIMYMCPCGCGSISALAFDTSPHQERPKWSWNNNKEKPTLRPSVQRTTACRWHGFLTDGIWRSV